MSDEEKTLTDLHVVLNRIYDVMINHPSKYTRTKGIVGEARALLPDSMPKALKKCNKAYKEALSESFVAMRFLEVFGEDTDDLYKNKKAAKLLSKYDEQLEKGEYDDCLKTIDDIAAACDWKKVPQFITVTPVDYTVSEDDPRVSFSVCNMSDCNISIENLTVQPSYVEVDEEPDRTMLMGSSTSFDLRINCPEGRYPVSYTLTYMSNLHRYVKQGTVSITVVEEDD